MSLIPSGFAKNAATAAGFYDHPIEQSLRLNDDDSAYLSWTPASAGNRKTWTWSGWVKLGNLGTNEVLFGANNGSTTQAYIMKNSSGQIGLFDYRSGDVLNARTTALHRDPSAWYHVVVVFDSTQATASDRVTFYVNGVEQAYSYITTPTQNLDGTINSTDPHSIGRDNYSTGQFYFDGYLAEVHFIDGTALDASSFGEFKSGVWIPKAYEGSYGTNGFYLDFDGTYYNDKSGNGNNFTANNLASTDVVLDSPTNNFATLNPLTKSPSYSTLYEGNLKHYASDNGWAYGALGTHGMPSGKWYFEVTVDGGNTMIGIAKDSVVSNGLAELVGAYTYRGSNGYKYQGTGVYPSTSWSGSAYGATYTNGDIIGVAYDADAGSLTFYKNNSSQGTAFTSLSGDFQPLVCSFSNTAWVNFGQDSSFAGNKTAQGNTDANGYGDFYYAPPTGYLALCTANLEVPDAMNPALDNSPQDYFNTVLYSGNSSTQSITGVGFQPDFVWMKNRASNYYHGLYDVVRGTGTTKGLYSNVTDAEGNNSAYQNLVSLDTDGFTLGSTTSTNAINTSGEAHVAWNWKAGGSGSSNTDGSITSTVSANTDAGFSIVSWTTDGSGNVTIGHGLSQAPTCIISKRRSGTTPWVIYHDGAGTSNSGFYFDTTAAHATADYYVTAPTSSVFTQSNSSYANYPSGNTCIAYCFHSVEGFSKFGSYTGNGSADGTFVYTGFRPAFVMYKRTDTATSWGIFDSARSGYNVANDSLAPNVSDAEYSGATYTYIDLLSNGFKWRRTDATRNASGGTYIFMAFSESPFKYSTAR